MVVEGGKYMLQLKQQQAEAFADKIAEVAATAGLERARDAERALQQSLPGSCTGMALPDAHMLFVRGGGGGGAAS